MAKAKKKKKPDDTITIEGVIHEAYAICDTDGVNPNLVSTDKKSLKDMLEPGEWVVKVLVVEIP